MFKYLLFAAAALLLSTVSNVGANEKSGSRAYSKSTPKLGEEYDSLICQIKISYDQGCLSYLVWALLNNETGILRLLLKPDAVLGYLIGYDGVLCPKIELLLTDLVGPKGTLTKLLGKGGALNPLLGYTKDGKIGILSHLVCFLVGSEWSLLGPILVKVLKSLTNSLLNSLLGDKVGLTNTLIPVLKSLILGLDI